MRVHPEALSPVADDAERPVGRLLAEAKEGADRIGSRDLRHEAMIDGSVTCFVTYLLSLLRTYMTDRIFPDLVCSHEQQVDHPISLIPFRSLGFLGVHWVRHSPAARRFVGFLFDVLVDFLF